jgi:hypothetical protein
MARFETAIRAVVDGQRRVLEDTQHLDNMRRAAGELTFAQLRSVLQLADQQQLLVDEVNDFGDVLGSLGVFRLALGEAAVDMQRAVGLLTERDVAKPTQQAEASALRRLEQIAQAFEKDDPPPGEGQGGGDGGGGGGEQGPQLQLAEIKLLRMLQIDLHERTDALREQTVAADGPIRGTITEAATRLADEQGRLAELVMEILSRDNADGPPADVDEPAEPNDDQRLDDLLDQLDEQL